MSRFFDPRIIAPAAICAVAALASPADAQQQTGDLAGTVTTADSKPLAKAKVTLSGAANIGGDKSVETNDSGEFRFLRLLPGEYKVTVEADGYEGLTTTLRVGIGKTARIVAPLKPAAGEDVEVIEVSAEKLAVDTKRIDIGTSFSAEFLQAVPSGREFQSVTQFAPGVTGGGNPNVNGGSDSSNLYLVDGVNTTDPTTNTFGLNFNFDAIEELQVLTGGFHPRYGNVTGGVINVVTKSGSNEFAIDSSVYYTGRLLQVSSPDEELVPEDERRNFWSIGANLNFSGPIIEDKLWYFVSTEYNYSVSQLPSVSPFEFPNTDLSDFEPRPHPERVYQSFYWLAKLTGQIDRHNRVTVLGIADPASIDNASQSQSLAPESEYHQDQNGFVGKLDWEADYDPLVVQVKAGYKRSLLDVMPQERVESSSPFGFPGVFGFGELSTKNDFGITPGCLADEDRVAAPEGGSGCTDIQAADQFGNGVHNVAGQGTFYRGTNIDAYIVRQQTDVTAELSYFLDEALGDHRFDLGFGVTLKSDEETERYPGGAYFIDVPTGAAPNSGDPVVVPVAAYVIGSENNELTQKATGQVFSAYLADTWTFADRFTLQPGIRVEKATHNDYLENPVLDFLTISPRLGFSIDPFNNGRTRLHGGYARLYETGNLGLSKFVGTSLQLRYTEFNGERYQEVPGSVIVFGGADGTTVDDDLQAMYSDEIRLGVEQAIDDTMALGVTYVRKMSHFSWEDDEINLLWNQAGTDVIGSRAGDGQQTYRLTSLEEARRTFDSMQLVFSRRGTDGWNFNGSYTLAWNRGTVNDTITAAFDNPRQNSYLEGDLGDDVRHNFKAQGFHEWNNGFTLGFSWFYETGTPYSPRYYNDFDTAYNRRNAPRGYFVGNDPNDPLDDRIQRLPDVMRLDARAAWNLEPIIGQKLTFMVDIFNLLNQNAPTSIVTNATHPDSEGKVEYTRFREVTGYQSPLRVRLGVRYQY